MNSFPHSNLSISGVSAFVTSALISIVLGLAAAVVLAGIATF